MKTISKQPMIDYCNEHMPVDQHVYCVYMITAFAVTEWMRKTVKLLQSLLSKSTEVIWMILKAIRNMQQV